MRKIWHIISLIVLGACSVGPDYQQPDLWEEYKPSFASGEQILSDKKWYTIFNDEILNQIINHALQNSPDIKTAKSKLRQARYSLNIKKVAFWPMIDAGGAYNYAYAPKYNEFGDKSDYFKVGLDASWELDIWGGGRRQTESYWAQYQASINSLDDALLSLTAEIANNYILLRATQEQLRISKENLHLQQDILNTVRDKYKSGLADDTALNQAEFAVQTTKSLIPDLEYQESAYRGAIEILAGEMPDTVEILTQNTKNIVAKTFNFDLSKLSQFSFENVRYRPDVRAAENMLVSKNAEIGQAIAALFPNVNVSALLGWQGHLIKDLGKSENAAYGYNPIVNLPFLHWGQLTNQVKLSKEIKSEYFYAYQNALLMAAQEVKNAVTAVKKEYEKNSALQKSVNNMQKVLSSMKIKYKEGLVEFSDLLLAEQHLLSAQNNLAASRGAVYQHIVSFYKSVGGGYCAFNPRK